MGFAFDQRVDDLWGFFEDGGEQLAGSLEVFAADMGLRGVILKAFDQDVFVGALGGAVPLEEQATVFRAGFLGEVADQFGEGFDVVGQGREFYVDQNHVARI